MIRFLLLCVSTFALVSCGGGGSSSPTSTLPSTVTPPVTPTPVTQTGFAYGRTVDNSASAPLLRLDDASGELVYGLYANHQQSNVDHALPDFSYAGYEGGGVALPAYDSIIIRETLSPQTGVNLDWNIILLFISDGFTSDRSLSLFEKPGFKPEDKIRDKTCNIFRPQDSQC